MRAAGGAFDGVMNDSTVFGYRRGEGIDAGSGEPEWIVAKDRHKYDQLFFTLDPIDGKITGSGLCVKLATLEHFLVESCVAWRQMQSRFLQ